MTATPESPEQRALAAAEELAAQGDKVTARAIRQAAGVRTAVAAAAAKQWNQQQAAEEELPPVPDSVQRRIAGIWGEAVTVARASHDAERQGWETQVAAAQAEARELEAVVDAAEAQVEQLRAELETIQALVLEQRPRTV